MAPKCALFFILVAVVMCATTLANDVPVKFCVRDCANSPKAGVTVEFSNCTDFPARCTTDNYGCCSIDTSYDGPHKAQYCSGSGRQFCDWSIVQGDDPTNPFIPDSQTLMRLGSAVTPNALSCCGCNQDGVPCADVIYADASTKTCPTGADAAYGLVTDSNTGFYTVTFRPKTCKCGDLQSTGHCPSGSIYDNSKKDIVTTTTDFPNDCCTSTAPVCKFGNKMCPTTESIATALTGSFKITPAPGTAHSYNVTFTNNFIYNAGCIPSVSWITLATCNNLCQKMQYPTIGQSVTLTDVRCGSPLYVVAHDGSYKKFSNATAPSQIDLAKCHPLSPIPVYLTKPCSSRDGAGGCNWVYDGALPCSGASIKLTSLGFVGGANNRRLNML